MRVSVAVAMCAATAVVVSAGSATAGSLVTTKMLKKNAVTSAKVKNGSLGLVDLAPSVRAAIQTPRVVNNTAVVNTRVVKGADVIVPAGEVVSAYAFCPAGTHPTGGGFFSSITQTGLSEPTGTSLDARGNGWAVAVNNTSDLDVTINAYAICA
jgi:hypothetical protein